MDEHGAPIPATPHTPRAARRLLDDPGGRAGVALLIAFVAVGLAADVLAPADPFRSVGPPLQPPSRPFPMGTDDLGRDVLSGVVHGTRTSLFVAFAVTLVTSVIGIAIGGVSGYVGGTVDHVLMRFTEAIQTLPRFFLAIVVVAFFGAGLVNLVVVLALTSWPWLARVIRAEVLSLKEREFVVAARALGHTDLGVLASHVLPNALPATAVVVSLNAAGVILLEASLGFVGLTDPTRISWGYLADNARPFLRSAWWMAVFPGLGIFLSVLGLNLLGDAVNEAFDPRTSRRRRSRPAQAGGPSRRRTDGGRGCVRWRRWRGAPMAIELEMPRCDCGCCDPADAADAAAAGREPRIDREGRGPQARDATSRPSSTLAASGTSGAPATDR